VVQHLNSKFKPQYSQKENEKLRNTGKKKKVGKNITGNLIIQK
jgi:hypothetical protein